MRQLLDTTNNPLELRIKKDNPFSKRTKSQKRKGRVGGAARGDADIKPILLKGKKRNRR